MTHSFVPENAKVVSTKKELDNLVHSLGEKRLLLRAPCMKGTRTAILQEIENKINNVDGPNVIWIMGSPGVGKSALAASIANRLVDQKRHVISFRFDRTESTITTSALWRTVACDLARMFPSLRQQLVQGNQGHSSYDIDRLFKSLIEEPLSTLVGAIPCEELPVIVIDALDECGGLRHDSSGKDDYKILLYTLKHWVQVDHLRRFKLVITSRPEGQISRIFPESISIHIAIPSGSNVKSGDSASQDIRTFLESRLNDMEMKRAQIAEALDYLVPGAAGIFIWATTVANFLEDDPEARFHILRSRERGDDIEGMDDLFSLYSTLVKASCGRISKQEVQGIVSVMGAMIYAKQPLSDDVLVMLPGVKIGKSNVMPLIRKGLASVVGTGDILRFHHKSFEDYLLSPSFQQEFPDFSTVQDRGHHERQLAMLCLKTLVSPELHFNMCNLGSSVIKNVDIPPNVKSMILPFVLYSSQIWADHLVHTPSDEPSDQKLKEGIKFVMYEKLLFWIETMSLSGKAYDVSLILKRALSWKVRLFVISLRHLTLIRQLLNIDDDLTSFIHDALRFISAFVVPISQHAAHVYLSALPFAPEASHVARKFCPRFPNTFVVTRGKPSQWPMAVFTAEHHKDKVWGVAFSPDKSTFLCRSDTTTYICDSETGRCILGPFHNRPGACFSPSGMHILLPYSSYAVIWDIEAGEEQFRIEGSDFTFVNHDGRIASVEQDGNSDDPGDKDASGILVRFWDASNGKLISTRLLEVNDVEFTEFSPDGHFLVIEKKSEEVIELRNLEDSKDFRRFAYPRAPVSFSYFSPDGHFLVIFKRFENVIELWNLEDSEDIRRFTYPHGEMTFLRFSPTSNTLMVGTDEKPGQIHLWRLDTQEMTSFSRDFRGVPHVIHLPLTSYLFIQRDHTVEIWDVSATGLKMVWETESASTSEVRSICPSSDGHRVLVGYYDGSVRMWNLDLENLAMNQAGTTDTRDGSDDDSDEQRVIRISPSGKMVITRPWESCKVKFQDATTGEVVAHTDIKFDEANVDIAFSPDEEQVAFLSGSLITICDIMYPEKCVSFNPWPGKDVSFGNIAFQTCNDLVICAILRDDSKILQVWHRQDPAGFKCTYSLDIEMNEHFFRYLAPNGLAVVIAPSSSPTTCYSWNHDAAHFDPVHFDDQVHIGWDPSPIYSPDGKLFAWWSKEDSHVRVWDTQTGHLVSKFPTSWVDEIALSPALTGHCLGERLIALRFENENTLHLFDAYTGHLQVQILGEADSQIAFMRDGTALAYYYFNSGFRIWEIADFTAGHRHSTDGHELMLQGMTDGWMMGQDDEPLFWVPVENRKGLYVPPPRVVIGRSDISTILDFSSSRLGTKWTECINKGWLRELEQKEKEY